MVTVDFKETLANCENILDNATSNPYLNKEAARKWMLTNGHITEDGFRSYVGNSCVASSIGVEQLLPQYNLSLECLKIGENHNLQIFPIPFPYLDFDGIYKIGNFFVPQFYIHSFIDEIKPLIHHYPKKYSDNFVEENNSDYLKSPLSEEDENKIICILNKLPHEKKDIHIGFFYNDSSNIKPSKSKYNNIISRLGNLGYDIHGLDDEKFKMTNFSWDDPWKSTITVLVDFVTYKHDVEDNIKRFLTFDGAFPHTYIPGRLIHISIFMEDCISNCDFKNGTVVELSTTMRKKWLQISKKPYFIFPIFTYYPQNSHVVTEDDKRVQKLIWNFIDGGNVKGIINNNITVLEECVELVASVLRCTFGMENCNELTLICSPASTKESYILRYRNFSELLSRKMGIYNGFDLIIYENDSTPKHLGGTGNPKVNISPEVKWRKIIVFDDVYTTGNTINRLCKLLSDNGGYVLGAIVLGITQHDKSFEKDLQYGYKGLFGLYLQNYS